MLSWVFQDVMEKSEQTFWSPSLHALAMVPVLDGGLQTQSLPSVSIGKGSTSPK